MDTMKTTTPMLGELWLQLEGLSKTEKQIDKWLWRASCIFLERPQKYLFHRLKEIQHIIFRNLNSN